jgi:hypothetical protein
MSVTTQKDVATTAAPELSAGPVSRENKGPAGNASSWPRRRAASCRKDSPAASAVGVATRRSQTKETLKSPLVTPPVGPRPAAPQSPPVPNVVQLPDIRIFDQITEPRPLGYQKEVERKVEQRSEELRTRRSRTGAIAQIKKYLYQKSTTCVRAIWRGFETCFPKTPKFRHSSRTHRSGW